MDPIFFALLKKREIIFSTCFGLNPNKKTCCENVKTIVWHRTLEMRDRKCLMHYAMSFDTFNNLVEELSPF